MEFPPLHPSLPPLFWIAIFLALAAGGGTVWLLAGKHGLKGNMWRQVVPLWGFIACMLAVGAALYAWLEHGRSGPVRVDASGVETPFATVGYLDMGKVYSHREVTISLIDPSVGRDTVKWLIIEEKSGKKHLLREDQYDLPAIMGALKGFLEGNRNGN